MKKGESESGEGQLVRSGRGDLKTNLTCFAIAPSTVLEPFCYKRKQLFCKLEVFIFF